MDTITLEENQIEDGQRLLDQLSWENVPIRAACWVKPWDQDRWSLYIATPLVEENGITEAYREMLRVLRSLGNLWISDSDIKLIGDKHSITREVLKQQQRFPGRTLMRSRLLGDLSIEDAYVYPPILGRDPTAAELRRVKKEVEQIARPEDVLLTEQREKKFRIQIISSGGSVEEAEQWIKRKRPQSPPQPPIRAGTVVKTWVIAYWGNNPEDDPNPLLLVEAPDGTRGLVLKNDTEPAQ